MATKNNPGKYDCYANADPDEPLFVLLGRDRMAASLVMLWAIARSIEEKTDLEKIDEAQICAQAMEVFANSAGQTPINVLHYLPFAMLSEELIRRGAMVIPIASGGDHSDTVEPPIDRTEYELLAHAMQSAVAMDHSTGSRDGEPKHLRVGINCAQSDQGGLASLLIAKGVFTQSEYVAAITESMRREVARYTELMSERMGTKVTFA